MLFFLLSCGFVNSQIMVHGQIIDSKTKHGIEYASVFKEGTNIGCICDSNGYFGLNNLKTIPDSLTISCVGYKSKKVYKNYLEKFDNKIIELDLKLTNLDEVTIKSDKLKRKMESLGSSNRKWFMTSPLYFASQNMRYFKSDRFPAYIESFSFYVTEINGNKKARIRIYNIDSIRQTPQNDILNTNVIAKDIKKGWNKVDLSAYRLLIPHEGFFIGLESIVIDKDCWEKVGENNYVTKYNDFNIGCVEEKTITARKQLRIGDYEKYGEEKILDLNEWRLDSPNRGFDLLFKVKIKYYE
jgi:hypothetical protein